MHNLAGSRILITGGAGLVGSHTCDLLIKEHPQEIIIFDNFSRGTKKNIEGALSSGLVRVIEADIKDSKRLLASLSGVDYCFHMAAIRITECAEQPRKCLEVLVEGAFNVLEACVRQKIKKIIVASSASVYGMADVFPTEESHHPYNNRTIYGAAKSFNEQLLRAFSAMYGIDYVALRYFNVYGPRMDIYGRYTEVLIRWLDCIDQNLPPRIYGDGLTSMDFIYAKDVARANILAIKSDVKDMVFNIASGKETNLKELLSTILSLTGSDLVPIFEEERKVNPVRRRLASLKLAEKYLNFKPEYTLEEGLKELIAWRKPQKR